MEPDQAERDRLAEVKPNPGRPTLHRLNRTEYANAIRDLLALELDVSEMLPADDIGYGFDNIGDVLSVSPGHELTGLFQGPSIELVLERLRHLSDADRECSPLDSHRDDYLNV